MVSVNIHVSNLIAKFENYQNKIQFWIEKHTGVGGTL